MKEHKKKQINNYYKMVEDDWFMEYQRALSRYQNKEIMFEEYMIALDKYNNRITTKQTK